MPLVGLLLGVTVLIQITRQLLQFFMSVEKRSDPSSAKFSVETSSFHSSDDLSKAWIGSRKFVVKAKVKETAGVMSYYLVPQDSKPLPRFLPGQFVTLGLNVPGQKKTVKRCYSLSSAPCSEYYRITVKQVLGGMGSTYLHEQVHVGSVLDVYAPSGKFHLDEISDKSVVLIAGGIGITPFLSMVDDIAENSARKILLVNSVRNGREHVRKEDLQVLEDQHPQLRVVTIYTAPEDVDIPGIDYDGTERISVDRLMSVLQSQEFEFYICGSQAMVHSLSDQLANWGVKSDSIHTEGFGGPQISKTTSQKKVSTPNADVQGGVDSALPAVRFEKSHKTVEWNSTAETILDLAEQHGVEIESLCRSGNCGACRIGLLSGCVKYDQKPEHLCEDSACLPCLAIPVGDIVLNA